MKRSVLLSISIIALVGLTACETVKGVGKDIENTGEAVTDAADNVQS